MKLSIADLRTDRHWQSATGLYQKRFGKLLGLFPAAYEQIYGQSPLSNDKSNAQNNPH